jgi:hypothetical protein
MIAGASGRAAVTVLTFKTDGAELINASHNPLRAAALSGKQTAPADVLPDLLSDLCRVCSMMERWVAPPSAHRGGEAAAEGGAGKGAWSRPARRARVLMILASW